MKKILILAIGLIAILSAFSLKASDTKKGNIQFETTIHDFGVIKEKNGAVSCEFKFVNTGDGNIFVTDAKAQCGCTRPSYPEAPIKPGKSGKIKVTYNPAGRPGTFAKTITLYLQNCKKSKISLKIRGKVE